MKRDYLIHRYIGYYINGDVMLVAYYYTTNNLVTTFDIYFSLVLYYTGNTTLVRLDLYLFITHDTYIFRMKIYWRWLNNYFNRNHLTDYIWNLFYGMIHLFIVIFITYD